MAKSNFFKGLGKPFVILLILFLLESIISIIVYYLYKKNSSLEGDKKSKYV
jgi:hypothetical protein